MSRSFSGIEAENVSFSYDTDTTDCIKDISVQLEPGHFYGLIGPNGSGKSTFIDLLSGFVSPTRGTINLNNRDIQSFHREEIAKLITCVPQSFVLNFDYTVEEIILMGRYVHIPRFSSPRESDYNSVALAIESMSIERLKHRNVTRLSGGEKQRVMIARSLAQDTDVILLDEVTSNLDINHSITIMKTMSKLVQSEGRTVVAALHDLNMASMFCDNLIVLKEGSVISFGKTPDVISEQLISSLYNVSSMVSVDQSGKKHIRFSYI